MKSKKRLSVLVILAVMVAMLALPMSAYAAVKINKTKATVEVGKTVTLKITGAKKGTKIKWTTNKKAVATVSSKGVVKGVKAGSAKITAKVGKKNYNCTVTVKAAATPSGTKVRVEDIWIEPIKYDVDLGIQFPLVLHSKDAVSWKSSDTSVATVDSNGVVTTVNPGEVAITAVSKKDDTQRASVRFDVLDGKKVKTENYTQYLNFELKRVPVLRYYNGTYDYNASGELVAGEWGPYLYNADGTPVYDSQGHRLRQYIGPVHRLSDIDVRYYLALDSASLQKGYDFDRTSVDVDYIFRCVPRTILTVDTQTWNNPSFDVTGGTRKQSGGVNVKRFDYTDFKNANQPDFDPEEDYSVYEDVYPQEFIDNPIFGCEIYSVDYYRSKPVKDSTTLRQYLFNNLMDMGTFHIYKVAGTIR